MGTKQKLADKLMAKKKELSERSAGGAFLTIKEGTTRVRHLPVGDENEFVIEAVYFYLGDKVKGMVSPKTLGKKCAVMQAYEKLAASKDPADRELAAKFKPQRKYFSPVIVYKDTAGKEVDTNTGVKMIALSSGLYNSIIDLYLDPDNGDFTDPKTGYDLKYKREGKGKQDTKYNVIAGRPSKLDPKFAKNEYDPAELIKAMVPTYEETKAKIDEFLSTPVGDDEDERPLSKKKKLLKKKKKSKDL
jgi:hypothetical protein